jgi:hypothetical protein
MNDLLALLFQFIDLELFCMFSDDSVHYRLPVAASGSMTFQKTIKLIAGFYLDN